MIVVRSKSDVNVRVNFGPWNQMLPHQSRPHVIPHRDTVPPVCEAKEWDEFEDEIVPSLRKFYRGRFRHPVHIPDDERTEMLNFLNEGPAPPTPPEWNKWEPPIEGENEVGAAAPAVIRVDAEDHGSVAVWRPFLQPRARRRQGCRCGSLTHQRTTHRDCPLNTSTSSRRSRGSRGSRRTPAPSVSATPEPADNEDAQSQPNVFPFPVGTWVAFTFADDTYVGRIINLYEGEDLCRVEFTDGDAGTTMAMKSTTQRSCINVISPNRLSCVC